MNFDWKNWCRFCGNPENNVKLESSIDIEYHFKISDRSPKVCESCNLSLNEIQEFLLKTEKSNQLFQELCSEEDLSCIRVNKIREKFDLEVLEIEEKIEHRKRRIEHINFKEDSNSANNDNQEDNDSDSKSEKIVVDVKIENFSDDSTFELEPSCSFEPNKRRKKSKSSKQSSISSRSKSKNKNPKKSKGDIAQVSKEKLIPTICHICRQDFPTMKHLQTHAHTEHNCRPEVPCICGFLINNYDTYIRHRKRCCSVLVAPYQCDLCSNKYASKNRIEKHMNAKHKSDSIKNKCKTCGMEFKYPTILKVHEKVHLPDEIRKIFACSYCDKRFATKAILNTHMATTHETHEKNFTCHLCAKNFKTKQTLLVHLETHNTTLDFPCKICSKRFKTNCLLKRHQHTHQPEKYFCNICNRGFRRFAGRTKHMISHSDERPFSCLEPTCTVTFKRKSDAQVHYNGVHLGKQRYLCRVCNKDFYYIKDRLEHMRQLHPQEYLQHIEKYKFLRKENRMMFEQKT